MNHSELLPFGIVPVEAALDDRLSKGELRMLIALFTFRNRSTGLCCPKREQLAARTGYSISMVSRMTTQLSKKGWLTKSGDGRYGRSSNYNVHTPEHLTIVATTAIVAATAPLTVAAAAPPIVAAAAPLNKQTIEHTIKQTKESVYFSEHNIESEFADYKAMRKQIRKPMNATSIKLFVTALKKLEEKGHNPVDLIEKATAHNWLSVYAPKDNKHETNGRNNGSGHRAVQTPLDRHHAAVAEFERKRTQTNERYVDGEVVGKDDGPVR